MTRNVVTYIINNQYDSAIKTIDGCSDVKNDPFPMVFKLAALSMRDVDYEKTIDSALFLKTYMNAVAMLEQWEKSNGASSYSQMLSGLCKTIHSAFYLRQKKYFSALQNGLDGLKLLREAQQTDSANYDVDLVLGPYEYGGAELRSRYWWVLFWYPGDRQTGIKRVERCAQNAIMTAEAAQLVLCDLYLQEKRFKDSKKVIDLLKVKYPGSRFVLWAEVKYFEILEQYKNAADVYHRLALSYEREKFGEYNALFTINKQAFMLYEAGDRKSANILCDTILERSQIGKYKELKRDTQKLKGRCHAADN